MIGYAAALFTTFALLPQIIRTWKLKETREISLFMPLMILIGSILWLIYGIMINRIPIVVSNALSVFFSLIAIFITIKYR